MHTDLSSAAQKAASLYTEIYQGLEERRVATTLSQDELNSRFEGTLGEEGIGLRETLAEFETQVFPGCMATASPMYMGLVNSSPLPAGPLADLLISALNNNGGTIHQNPAIAATESEVVRNFSRLVYDNEGAAGMLLPGGTFANLQGLMLARTRHFPEWLEKGPTGLKRSPRIYLSEATHFCVERVAQVLGLGRDNIRTVPTVGRGSLCLERLRQMLDDDRQHDHQPFAVVGSLGTTGTGAIDDLSALAELCREEEIWLHIDACYGGASLLLEEMRGLCEGVRSADSVAVDPHKWFFVPMVAGLLLTKHPELEKVFASSARSYIPGPSSSEPYLRGIPTSRRASALAVWMCLRAHGWSQVREAVGRNIELTRLLESKLRQRGFEVLPEGRLSVACFRAEGGDELQSRISERVVESGQGWFGTVEFEGRRWMRCNIVNLYTTQEHVTKIVELIASAEDFFAGR